ncbi:MAG: hypothetical protein ABI383_11370 [Acidobacteriaceae bacterium]
MKNVEEMIACVAISGAVLLAPAQKMFHNAEGMLRTGLGHNAYMTMAVPLPPLPPAPAVATQKRACLQRDVAKMQANVAREQARMQSEVIRNQAHWQAEIARHQVRAAMQQARWADSRGR